MRRAQVALAKIYLVSFNMIIKACYRTRMMNSERACTEMMGRSDVHINRRICVRMDGPFQQVIFD
jgi:hypothetical protein